jgi:hypothetical protein
VVCYRVSIHPVLTFMNLYIPNCFRDRWEDNIKMDVQEVGGGRGDWMELAQDRVTWRALVSTAKNLRVP